MKARTLAYYFKEAFLSLRRNGLMGLASAGTVAVALLILGSAMLMVLNVNHAIESAQNELQISVFLHDGVDDTLVEELEKNIKGLPGVEKIEYISKAEGLEKLKESFRDKQNFLEFGDRNPLPDTFKVKVENTEQVTGVADQIRPMSGVEKVKYPLEVVQKLLALTKWLRLAGAIVIILLGLAAIFLISTTIRLTVFARRREIGIMKFLGATDWFIRWPFIMEGVFLGLAGALVAILVIYFSYSSLIESIKTTLPFLPIQTDVNTVVLLLEALLGVGILIGAIGSIISVRKFLKV
jgi:cell division transport system permease protein